MRAAAEGAAASLSGRGRFVLDFIYDLQNNRLKKNASATGIADYLLYSVYLLY